MGEPYVPALTFCTPLMSLQKFPSIQLSSRLLSHSRRMSHELVPCYLPNSNNRASYYQYYSQTPYQYSYPPPQAAQPSAAATVAQAQSIASTSRIQPVTAQQAPAATTQESNTDIATLNDALGSAGVDLRVRCAY